MKSSRTLRFGIAGLGTASTAILPEIVAHPHMKVTAAADPRREALGKFASQFGGETYESVEAMCKSPNVDAVFVCTPNHLHAEHTITAAEHGKQVIVEKPMALTLDECAAMIAATERNGVRLLVGHTHGFDAPVRAMARIIHSGELGRPLMLNGWYFTDWIYRPRMPDELTPAKGGGVVYRQGPHHVDIMRILGGGMVRSVRGSTTIADPARAVEGSYMAFLDFENGAAASITFSGYARFDSSELTGGVGETGRRRDPEAHLKSHARVQGYAKPEDEWTFKDAVRFGGARQGEWEVVAAGDTGKEGRIGHPFFGVIVASCERGDIRQTPAGLRVYENHSRREIEIPMSALEREAELDFMYNAWANDAPLAAHDGRWGRATLEVCLGILQSARERREVSMLHQTSYVLRG